MIERSDWWQRLIGRIDTKDTGGFVEFLADDAEFRFGNAEPIHGRDAIAAAVEGFFGSIKESRHRIERTWDDGATRVCHGMVCYTRHDGSRVTLPFVNVFYMDGERIARYLIHIDMGPLYAPSP